MSECTGIDRCPDSGLECLARKPHQQLDHRPVRAAILHQRDARISRREPDHRLRRGAWSLRVRERHRRSSHRFAAGGVPDPSPDRLFGRVSRRV